MKVFVTGGSGYLGAHIIDQLIAEGHEVTGHARSERAASRVRALGVRAVVAPLTTTPALNEVLAGHDAVVHAAAHFALWGPWRPFQEGIIDATLALHRAATEADVKRFVYISAAGVVSGDLPPVVDESTPYPRRFTAHYARAKALTETALRLEPQSTMTTLVLRPPLVWGGRMPVLEQYEVAVRAGRIVWVDGGRRTLDVVHADNLSRAAALALTRGRDREVYFVTDDAPVSVKTFFSALLTTRGLKQGERSVPGWLARAAAAAMERVWTLRGSRTPPPLTRFFAEAISRDRTYSVGKAKRELGYAPVVSRQQGLDGMKTRSKAGEHL